MENQSDFLFADGPMPKFHPPDPRDEFYREVAAVWNLPLGEKIRVLLHAHDLLEISGRLELTRAPDLPLNAKEPLQLTAGGVPFLSTQVQAWSLRG